MGGRLRRGKNSCKELGKTARKKVANLRRGAGRGVGIYVGVILGLRWVKD